MAALTPEEERRRYVTAFNSTMIKIWRERIALLKVIDTGALYRSTLAVGMTADGKVTSVTLSRNASTPTAYSWTTAQAARCHEETPAILAATKCANAANGSPPNTTPP